MYFGNDVNENSKLLNEKKVIRCQERFYFVAKILKNKWFEKNETDLRLHLYYNTFPL